MAGILHAINAPIGGASGLSIFVDTSNVNVRNMLLANGWDGVSVVNPVVIIGLNVKIYSTSTSIPAFQSGTLPAGSTLTLVNNGLILGRGGNGGNGGIIYPGNPFAGIGYPGSAGGTGLVVTIATTISNFGAIAGGGGGGGGASQGGGGGGGGIGISTGGAGGYGTGGASSTRSSAGYNGSLTQAGGGGYTYSTVTGGNGGLYGTAGEAGDSTTGVPGGAGGAAGVAVNGDSLITWSVLGTIYGARTG